VTSSSANLAIHFESISNRPNNDVIDSRNGDDCDDAADEALITNATVQAFIITVGTVLRSLNSEEVQKQKTVRRVHADYAQTSHKRRFNICAQLIAKNVYVPKSIKRTVGLDSPPSDPTG
jgi:hypothetical protein